MSTTTASKTTRTDRHFWPYKLEILGEISGKHPLLRFSALKIKELYTYTQMYSPDMEILDSLKEEYQSTQTMLNFERYFIDYMEDIYVQLINERVTCAVHHVLASIEDIDFGDKLSDIYQQNHSPGTLQNMLIEAFERHSSFHRNQDAICPGNENDLHLATLLPWNGDIIMHLDSSCGENYIHPISSIENCTVSTLNDTELSILQTIQGISITKFFSISQNPNEDLYSYSMRICHEYRVTYPHENPMNSLACKRIFIKGLNDYHRLFFKKFSLQDIIQNCSITFREIFGWLYLYTWLDKYKYSSSPSVNSLNPPPTEVTQINPIDLAIIKTNRALIKSGLKDDAWKGNEIIDLIRLPRLTHPIVRAPAETDSKASNRSGRKRKPKAHTPLLP